MRKYYIAYIFEGAKMEQKIMENIYNTFSKEFHSKQDYVFLPFKTNIYTLWKELEKDEDQNVIPLLAEKDKEIAKILKKEGLDADSIGEIYLFFDYDGHARVQYGDEIIQKMLERFDNETDPWKGKLYISYPMVESLKDLKKEDKCFRRCHVPAKKNVGYKQLVGNITDFADMRNYNQETWNLFLYHNLCKANCIILNGNIPTYDEQHNLCELNCTVSTTYKTPNFTEYQKSFSPENIFKYQIKKFLSNPNHPERIAVLSSFPFLLQDYFNASFYNEAVSSK